VSEISFSYERMSTKTRFKREAKGNSEMAFSSCWDCKDIYVSKKIIINLKNKETKNSKSIGSYHFDWAHHQIGPFCHFGHWKTDLHCRIKERINIQDMPAVHVAIV